MMHGSKEGKSKNKKRGRPGSEANIYTLHKVLLMEEYTSAHTVMSIGVHVLISPHGLAAFLQVTIKID